MKIYSFFLTVCLFMLAACTNSAPKEVTDAADEAKDMVAAQVEKIMNMPLSSADEIEDWIGEIIIGSDDKSIPVSNFKTIKIDDRIMEVRIVNPDGAVTIVEAASPSWQLPDAAYRYYTKNSEVVALEEYKKLEDGFELDMIYFNEGKIISANSRKGATLEEARNAIPQEHVPSEEDAYNDYAAMKKVAEDIRTIFKGS